MRIPNEARWISGNEKAHHRRGYGGQCRDDWIRTSGLFVPNEARYRAALHPEKRIFVRFEGSKTMDLKGIDQINSQPWPVGNADTTVCLVLKAGGQVAGQ